MALLKTMATSRHRPTIRRRGAIWGVALFALCAVAGVASPPSPPSAEYQVKAVFLFNFAQFVEWPARAFADSKAPLVIGILGDDPFGSYLDDLVQGEMIGDRPMVVRRYRRVEDIADCHILFINRSKAAELEKIIPALQGRSILTVADADDFCRHGGMIRFVTENGKIRLRANLAAAKASDLIISSKILKAATIVTRDQD
jgi:hypothetical protein